MNKRDLARFFLIDIFYIENGYQKQYPGFAGYPVNLIFDPSLGREHIMIILNPEMHTRHNMGARMRNTLKHAYAYEMLLSAHNYASWKP